jgi:hypothetical protein
MGTVLLLAMINGWVIASAMLCAAALTYVRSASPPLPWGVPTAMKTSSPRDSPSWYELVKCRRPACALRRTISSSPGS